MESVESVLWAERFGCQGLSHWTSGLRGWNVRAVVRWTLFAAQSGAALARRTNTGPAAKLLYGGSASGHLYRRQNSRLCWLH
mmetsp:Transcript_39106/g.124329  ORF Transcript_39106/g.124329 Transcript_39106/m.124329 type:complete len:82 (-) Transcript_39106:966-1211(-)